MKILVISDAWFPQINGVVRTYEHLHEELEKTGHDVKVLGPADFPWQMPMPGYAEIKLALFPYKKLSQYIKSFNPDHIHIATEGPLGWAGRKFCKRHALSYSSSYHTQFPEYTARRVAKVLPFLYEPVCRWGIKYVRRFHEPSSALLVATPSLEKTLKEWGFKNPMYRFSRGAKTDQFFLKKANKFDHLPKPVALYVGRVAVEKSIEDFLEMEWTGSKVVVGDGPSRPELEKKFTNAHFLGNKTGTELADYYRSADVFVFPSRTDTFGMVIVEALACGIPVAAYDVTGPKDILTEDFLGALTDNDLAAATQTALKCGSAEKRAHYVLNHYSWPAAAQEFIKAVKTTQKT